MGQALCPQCPACGIMVVVVGGFQLPISSGCVGSLWLPQCITGFPLSPTCLPTFCPVHLFTTLSINFVMHFGSGSLLISFSLPGMTFPFVLPSIYPDPTCLSRCCFSKDLVFPTVLALPVCKLCWWLAWGCRPARQPYLTSHVHALSHSAPESWTICRACFCESCTAPISPSPPWLPPAPGRTGGGQEIPANGLMFQPGVQPLLESVGAHSAQAITYPLRVSRAYCLVLRNAGHC